MIIQLREVVVALKVIDIVSVPNLEDDVHVHVRNGRLVSVDWVAGGTYRPLKQC